MTDTAPEPPGGGRGATRTCAVTRRSAPRDDLLRLVASPDGDVVVDARGTLPGRGVWVWPDAAMRRALPKQVGRVAKGLGVAVDPAALDAAIVSACTRAVLDGLSIAAAAGALVPGQDRVGRALLAGRLEAVVLCDDLSSRTRDTVRAQTDGVALLVTLPLSSVEVGARTGRGPTGVFGVPPARPARHLLRWLRRLHALG